MNQSKIIKLTSIKSGLYRLTEDIDNPAADRRSRDAHKLPYWEKGTEIRIKVCPWPHNDYPTTVKVIFVGTDCYLETVYKDDSKRESKARDGILEMIQHLEPISVDSVRRAMQATREPYSGRHWIYILQRLIDVSSLTLQDVHEALRLAEEGALSKIYGDEDE